MHNIAAYTHLESLFLFQSLGRFGLVAGVFDQISDELKTNELINTDDAYDAARLSPDALRELFLHLLREELVIEAELRDRNGAGGLSPNSKKRKIQAAPLPTLREAQQHTDRLPVLINNLYARYRAVAVQKIREDEWAIENLQQEIAELERAEKAAAVKDDIRDAVSQNGTPGLKEEASPEIANGAVSAAVNTPTQEKAKPGPGPRPPAVPEQANPLPSAPPHPLQSPLAAASPVQHAQPGLPFKPREPPQPPDGASPLQPPNGVKIPPQQQGPASLLPHPPPSPNSPQPPQLSQSLQSSQALQASQASQASQTPPDPQPSQPPRASQLTHPQSPHPDTSPRLPENIKGKPPTQNSPTQYKWEPQYQPPQTPQASIPRQPQPARPGPPLQQNAVHLKKQSPQPVAPYLQPGPPPSPQTQNPLPQARNHVTPQQRPVLLPPRHVGQVHPPMSPPPILPHTNTPTAIIPPAACAPSPIGQPGRELAPPPVPHPTQQPPYQAHPQLSNGRRSVGPTPTPPPPGPTGQYPISQQHGAQGWAVVAYPQYGQSYQVASPSPSPLQRQPDGLPQFSSPLHNQTPRPPFPGHVALQHPAVNAMPTGKAAQVPLPLPQTPLAAARPQLDKIGSGTKWKVSTGPATPKPEVGELASPAMEPLSPVLRPGTEPSPTPVKSTKKQSAKKTQAIDTPSSKPRGRPPRSTPKAPEQTETPAAPVVPKRSESVASQQAEAVQEQYEPAPAKIKDEVATPRPHDETGDTTADESMPSRRNLRTPTATTGPRVGTKRKRHESPQTSDQVPSGPPSHVLWARGFPKISAASLDQISGHCYANMFANPIRDRDAPGYKNLVLRPQSLKSIRMAITQGNKAAMAAARELPAGEDLGSSSVWLPISEDLVPPKGIINSEQLDRELAHMFCNAIMYNPDTFRGPGPGFKRGGRPDGGDDDEGNRGYEVDENGVVNNTRTMFHEVERQLSDLRNTERERGAPPLPKNATGTRHPSMTYGAQDRPRLESLVPDEEADEQATTDADTSVQGGGGMTKRRRITRHQEV